MSRSCLLAVAATLAAAANAVSFPEALERPEDVVVSLGGRLPMSDVLAGRRLDEFRCPQATPEVMAETFSLTNGVLHGSAAHALILESPETYGVEAFLLTAEVRYDSAAHTDAGLVFGVTHPGKGARRTGVEYQLKAKDIGDAWSMPGACLARHPGDPWLEKNAEGYSRLLRQQPCARQVGAWHRVAILKLGAEVAFYYDGRQVNRLVVGQVSDGRIGFQTKPYPEGRGGISFRQVRIAPLPLESKKGGAR